jgi:hypothetical protein
MTAYIYVHVIELPRIVLQANGSKLTTPVVLISMDDQLHNVKITFMLFWEIIIRDSVFCLYINPLYYSSLTLILRGVPSSRNNVQCVSSLRG